MKKAFGYLGMAILGGVIALGGFKLFNEPVIVKKQVEQPMQTWQTNFKPAINEVTKPLTSTDFTKAAEKTVNTVVHVKNTATSSSVSSWSDLFYGNGSRKQVGTGSGVIISPDGYIITNNHVIANASELEITLNNQKKYKAELIGTDEKNDIALLKINADNKLPYIPFANSDTVKIGEWVLAVGNPYNLTSTVTAGIVSAKGRDLEGNRTVDSFIQTDAAVNPGNSGGALVNTRGELIGINTAITSKTGSFIGYSFAVPSNIARKIVDDLLEFGSVQDAIIGFSPEVKDEIEGVIIREISEESNAKKAGLKDGDIIKKINDVKISKFSELTGQLTAKRPGDYVNVTVDRDGDALTKRVKLIKRTARFISTEFQWELKDLTTKELKKFGISNGVKIIRTGNDTNAKNTLKGFIITKINDKKISKASIAVKQLDNLSSNRYSVLIEMINLEGERERFRFR
ncbi:S1-C subfamily serine protease [Lutibacter sp. Hel_I_33_5]|uniref:S1C family serine protease n=1 Tax=Lutibacter sp. Hel_I_33_5 TaxID=1566289 RepID=UPI0011A32814|nr:trypsin-like peptidase domain-containing protein [Lutibacter sp. Hel_I_33_5]TVZ55187.1 S1-C subfamily serine protease [Lutibacter sp. Hel_I_33_5]